MPSDAQATGPSSRSPEATIAIPVYNGAQYIEAAVVSALAQTGGRFEVLVVDNASTDDTVARVESLRDPRLRVVRNSQNLGMTGNFNRCLELSRGVFVKFLCADDTLEPGCTAKLLTVMREHPGATLVSCARRLMDTNGRTIGLTRHADRLVALRGVDAIRHMFHVRNIAGEPTAVMFRRSEALRGFDPAYSQALDVEMWFHLLSRGDLVLVPDVLCSVRMHEQQGTRANLRSGRLVEDKRRLFRAYAERAGVGASTWLRLLWDLRMVSSLYRSGPETIERARREGLSEVYFPLILLIALSVLSRLRRHRP